MLRMTQGPDPALARPGESHSELRETGCPTKGQSQPSNYLKANKPDPGYFQRCNVKTEKLSKITS